MNNLTVNKTKLLHTLKENKANHRREFLEAQKNYRAEVIKQLDERLYNARQGKKIDLYFRLPEPLEYTDEYDSEIQALEWHQGNDIELDQDDFNRLVLNKWHWANAFAASTQIYNNR